MIGVFALGGVLQRVIVGAVYVKTCSRHLVSNRVVIS